MGVVSRAVLVLAAAAIALLAFACASAAAGRGDRCFFLAAGRGATADGSVLLAYANDWSASNWMAMSLVAPADGKRGFLKFRTRAARAEGGLNDRQLGLIFGAETDIDPAVLAADPYPRDGWGFEIWNRILSRCTTAEQAIDMLAGMAEGRGISPEGAGSLAVGDTREVWVFETLGGHHWVAARVPEDEVWIHPNMVCIRQVDLSDPENFRGSDDLIGFAQRLGRYDPADGLPFDVAWAYNDRAELSAYYDRNRLWGAVHKLAPSLGLPADTPWARLPVHVVPDRKLTVRSAAAVLRYHYEGTELDESLRHTAMSPHKMTTRPICAKYTDYTAVTQLRDWLPDSIGGVLWVSHSRPCSSVYVPFYSGVSAVPAAWRDHTAFDTFRAVCESLDRPSSSRLSRYTRYHPAVERAYAALERRELAAQPRVEAAAVKKHGAARSRYLTAYCDEAARRALALARSLPARMP